MKPQAGELAGSALSSSASLFNANPREKGLAGTPCNNPLRSGGINTQSHTASLRLSFKPFHYFFPFSRLGRRVSRGDNQRAARATRGPGGAGWGAFLEACNERAVRAPAGATVAARGAQLGQLVGPELTSYPSCEFRELISSSELGRPAACLAFAAPSAPSSSELVCEQRPSWRAA